jgi:hypothetical protein
MNSAMASYSVLIAQPSLLNLPQAKRSSNEALPKAARPLLISHSSLSDEVQNNITI